MNGPAFAGELTSIAHDGEVTFRLAQDAATNSPSSRVITLNELVRWGHPLRPRPQTFLVLANGGRLVTAADWAGGAAVKLDEDRVIVRSDIFDDARLPRNAVRGIVFAQRSHPDERATLAHRVLAHDGKSDGVFLTNGDQIAGEMTELHGGSLSMATQAGVAKLPLSRVEALVLGGNRQPSAVSRRPEVIVGLRDGSLLYSRGVQAGEDALAVEIADNLTLAGGSVDDVVALQSLDGPFLYLSDLEPAAYRHVPYLELEWPHERDRNVTGGPLVVDGKCYLKGIGMHSASRLTYALEGRYQRFDAAVAIDDSAEGRGSVTFAVYVLEDGQWHEAFKTGVVRGGETPQPVSVDVSNAKGLTLTVDFADRGDELDRAVWLDARLTKLSQ